jgi:hypothetical protein
LIPLEMKALSSANVCSQSEKSSRVHVDTDEPAIGNGSTTEVRRIVARHGPSYR